MNSTLRIWPPCADEFATILRCLQGYSLSRFGDGELKLMYTQGYVREPFPSAELSAELRDTMLTPGPMCIVGIPTMDPKGPKYQFTEPRNGHPSGWVRHRPRFMQLLNESSVPLYYSAFVTRPDSAPWIRTLDYAKQIESLWASKKAVVVCEKGNSIYKVVRHSCGSIEHIRCPSHRAYAEIGSLESACTVKRPDIVIISAGPTATCLANRLSKRGIQALDLGSIGGWLGQLLEV